MKITVTEKFDEQGRVVERTTVYGEASEVPSHQHWWFRPEPSRYPFPGYNYPLEPGNRIMFAAVCGEDKR